MMTKTSLTLYRIFVVVLANLMGGGLHDAILTSRAWYQDPVRWVAIYHEPPGAVHPFLYTSGLLTIVTLVTLAVLARYRGPAYRSVLFTLIATAAILVATFFWFVPMSNAVRAAPARLPEADVIYYSRIWVVLNVTRQILYIGILYQALVTLGRIGRARESDTAAA